MSKRRTGSCAAVLLSLAFGIGMVVVIQAFLPGDRDPTDQILNERMSFVIRQLKRGVSRSMIEKHLGRGVPTDSGLRSYRGVGGFPRVLLWYEDDRVERIELWTEGGEVLHTPIRTREVCPRCGLRFSGGVDSVDGRYTSDGTLTRTW